MEKELNILSGIALSLAKSRGFESVSLYVNSHWNGFVVFEANPLPKSFIRLPLILVKDDKARWANADEATAITILYQ